MQEQREIAADAFAAQLVLRTRDPALTGRDVMSAMIWACGTTDTGDGHPSGEQRIKAFSKFLGPNLCPDNHTPLDGVPACEVPHT